MPIHKSENFQISESAKSHLCRIDGLCKISNCLVTFNITSVRLISIERAHCPAHERGPDVNGGAHTVGLEVLFYVGGP